MIFFSPSKLKYSSVESHRLQTFFRVLSKWFINDGKPIKFKFLSFPPSGAKRDARFALVIVAG